jgi:hypothetical protein
LRWQWNTLIWVYFPSSGLTATTKELDTLLALSPSPACHGIETDKPCDVSGVSNFAVAVEYTLVVILYIVRVDTEGVPLIVQGMRKKNHHRDRIQSCTSLTTQRLDCLVITYFVMMRASNYTTQTGDVQLMILSYIQPARIPHSGNLTSRECYRHLLNRET